jgi:hypothetical protein
MALSALLLPLYLLELGFSPLQVGVIAVAAQHGRLGWLG